MIFISISTFNSANTLRQTLDSLLSQKYLYWRANVIDGGSTDKTREIVKEYSEIDSRIILDPIIVRSTWRNSALRHLNTFNNYIEQFSYFMWLDPDDFLSADYLENCMEEYQSSNSKYIGCIGTVQMIYKNEMRAEFHPVNYYSPNFVDNNSRYIRCLSHFLVPNRFGATNLIYAIWKPEVIDLLTKTIREFEFAKVSDWDRVLIFRLINHGKIKIRRDAIIFRRLKDSVILRKTFLSEIVWKLNPLILFFVDDYHGRNFREPIIKDLQTFQCGFKLTLYFLHSMKNLVNSIFLIIKGIYKTFHIAYVKLVRKWVQEKK